MVMLTTYDAIVGVLVFAMSGIWLFYFLDCWVPSVLVIAISGIWLFHFLDCWVPTEAEKLARLQRRQLAVDLRGYPCHIQWCDRQATRMSGAHLQGLVDSLQATLAHAATGHGAYLTAPLPESPLRAYSRQACGGCAGLLEYSVLDAVEKRIALCRRLRWAGGKPFCAGSRLVGQLHKMRYDVEIFQLRRDNAPLPGPDGM